MSMISKSMLTVVVTTAVVAVLGYFFGFSMLFAHTMAEIFWYAGLFGGANVLTLGVLWFANRDSETSESTHQAVETTKKTSTTQSAKTATTAA